MKKILSILFLTLVSASLIVTARALDDLQYSPVEDIETTAAEDPVELPSSYPASGTEGSIIIGKVIGQTLGWGDNPQSGAAAAFDGDPHTFFDPMGVGDGFCGIEAETDYILDKVAILSREDWSERFAGAMIQGSRDGETWVTLWTSHAPAASATEYTIVTDFENNSGYSRFRYFNETNHGDVAEVEFYGKEGSSTDGVAFSNLTAAAVALGSNPITEYLFLDGSEGLPGEGPDMLWDNDVHTKFNQIVTGDELMYSVAETANLKAYHINGVILATANDTASYDRRPLWWAISGSTDGETWDLLAEGDQSFFGLRDLTYFAMPIPETDKAYSQFRFDAKGSTGGGSIQLAEAVVCTSEEYVSEKYALAESEIHVNEGDTYTPVFIDVPADVTITKVLIPDGLAEFDPVSGSLQFTNLGGVSFDIVFYFSDGKMATLKAHVSIPVDFPEESSDFTWLGGFRTVKAAAEAIGSNPITDYIYTNGAGGFPGEGPENLWDGDLGSKFCTELFPAVSTARTENGQAYRINGVLLATANDSADYNGRDPKKWAVLGSSDGGNWDVILSGDDSFFEETNFTYYAAEFPTTEKAYSMFRFIAESADAGVMQLSEAVLLTPDEYYMPSYDLEEPEIWIQPEYDEHKPVFIGVPDGVRIVKVICPIHIADYDEETGIIHFHAYEGWTGRVIFYFSDGRKTVLTVNTLMNQRSVTMLWDFGEDGMMNSLMGRFSCNDVTWEGKEDYYVFTAQGNDPFVSVDLEADDASDITWVKVRAKNLSPATAIEFFAHTDGRGLTGADCAHVDLASDSEWHTYIVNILDSNVKTVNAYKQENPLTEPSWKGHVDFIRLDPMWREGDDGSDNGGSMSPDDRILIDYIAFFPTKEGAEAFREGTRFDYNIIEMQPQEWDKRPVPTAGGETADLNCIHTTNSRAGHYERREEWTGSEYVFADYICNGYPDGYEGVSVLTFSFPDGKTDAILVKAFGWGQNFGGQYRILNGNLDEIHEGGMTYDNASQYADFHGGHLMTIDSEEEKALLDDMISAYDPENRGASFWMGGSGEPMDLRIIDQLAYLFMRDEENPDDFWWQFCPRYQYDRTSFIVEYDNWESWKETAVLNPDNGHVYYAVPSGFDWDTAWEFAQKAGGYLMTVTGEGETAILERLNPEGKNFWLGGFADGAEWEWLTGEPFDYTVWAENQPDSQQYDESGKIVEWGENRIGTLFSPAEWNDWVSDPYEMQGFVIEVETIRGDVNGDGNVNSNDAIYLLRYTMNKDRYPINQSGDMNGDGKVDSNDAIYLLRHTMNKTRYPLFGGTETSGGPAKTYLPTEGAEVEPFPADGLYVDYTVNYGPAGTISGGTRTELSGGKHSVKAVPNLGYRFVRWSDGQTNPSRIDSADTISKSTVLTAIFDYDILDMPIISIDTETAEDVKSKTEYINADLRIMGTEKEYELSETVQIRGRGNNTWTYEKKSYKMKFPDKVNLFDLGTGKDKVWVLLANVCDQSLQRNHVSLELARSLDGVAFSPASLSVEVYLNGEYRGVYLLAEEIKDSKARVNIDTKGYETSTDIGYLVELSAYADHDDFWAYDRKHQVHNDLSEDTEVSGQQIDFIREYMEQCWQAMTGGNRESIGSLMDIDSLVDTYLAEEIVKNLDVGWDSYYLYKEKGGKLFFGPLWDFDLALGNANEGEETIDGLFAATHSGSGGGNPWYYTAMEYEWFRELVVKRWDEVKADIVDKIPGQILAEGSSKLRSYERNFDRWQIFGTCQNRETEAIMALKNYTEHYEYLADWLSQRIAWLDEIYHNENFLTMELESFRPMPDIQFFDPDTETLFQSLTNLTETVGTSNIEGTVPGFEGEGVENLFDGDAVTKYCWAGDGETEIVFRTKEAVTATHYAFMTANDTRDYDGRNPEQWKIYGSADGENWDLIAEQDNGRQVLAQENYTWSVFAFDHPGTYEYYKVWFSNDNVLQFSELALLN